MTTRGAARLAWALCVAGWGAIAHAQLQESVVDLPTRPGVTQRLLHLAPPDPWAAVVLLAGGHGGLQIGDDARPARGRGNFLVRNRHRFAELGLTVVVLDAPSDRGPPMFLSGFRQTPEHATDVRAAIAWLRRRTSVPVWLVGTSRGTQSAAYVATAPVADAQARPDGLVLTATILADPRGRAVPQMPIGRLDIPVLVVHHAQDGCPLCRPGELAGLMRTLEGVPRRELVVLDGGESRGDPCEAFAYHGFNGIDALAVRRIVVGMRSLRP